MYAKMQDTPTLRWQYSSYDTGKQVHSFDTDTTIFPEWITDETFMGDDEQIDLRTYLHEACLPFKHEQHLHASKVLYYLVIRNDYPRQDDGGSIDVRSVSNHSFSPEITALSALEWCIRESDLPRPT